MKRGSVHQSEIAVVIIAIVILMLLLSFTGTLTGEMRDSSDIELCRESLILNEKIKTKSGALIDTSIECPAKQYDIRARNYEEVYYLITDQLEKCWYKMLERNNKMFANTLSPSDDYVIVCSTFDVYKKGNVVDDIDTEDLGFFLDKPDPVTQRPYALNIDTDWYANGNLQFFINAHYKGKDDIEFTPLEKINVSDKEDKTTYAVVFVMYSKNGWFHNSVELESYNIDVQYSKVIRTGHSDSHISFHTYIMPVSQLAEMYGAYLYWQVEDE